ncbi:MAG TPA: LysR family transcriptional regulator [Solirubrobacteraceae bacterium]|nr:LysR family transcriptional regulator [Solirubrobacteraceae bacterium]
MDVKRVLTFRAVTRARSFSRAARELSLSQPSVSQQVAGLERELGVRLLDRRPGGLRVTRAGAVLLVHADAVAERLALAGTQLAEIAASERSTLRVGAFPTALASLVPAAVARLEGARVIVEEGASQMLAERVRAGDLHVAVTFQDAAEPRREPAGLERRDLLREQFLVVLAPDHPLADRESVALAELAGEGWTAPSADGIIVRACRAAGFEPRLSSITRDQLAIRALVARGLAVTLVPSLLAEAFRDLPLRPLADASPERDVYALLPPGGRHPLAGAAVAALAAAVAELGA